MRCRPSSSVPISSRRERTVGVWRNWRHGFCRTTSPGIATRHLALGHAADGRSVSISAFGDNVLIAGPSGSGKVDAGDRILEQLRDLHYQFCILDPEGDFQEIGPPRR